MHIEANESTRSSIRKRFVRRTLPAAGESSRPAYRPPVYEDITVGDISTLIGYLFITRPFLDLLACL